MRTLMFIISVTVASVVLFALTSASPISDSTTTEATNSTKEASTISSSSTHADELPVLGHHDKPRLVITHVIQSLEFEVDLLDDDNTTSSTGDETTPMYIETMIDILNPELLKEIVENETQTETGKTGQSIDGTKDLENEKNSDY